MTILAGSIATWVSATKKIDHVDYELGMALSHVKAVKLERLNMGWSGTRYTILMTATISDETNHNWQHVVAVPDELMDEVIADGSELWLRHIAELEGIEVPLAGGWL